MPKGFSRPPRGYVQAWTVLHGKWLIGAGMQRHLHFVDHDRLRHIFTAQHLASYGCQHELCISMVTRRFFALTLILLVTGYHSWGDDVVFVCDC